MCPHCLKSTLCMCKSCTGRRIERNTVSPLKPEMLIDSMIGIFLCPYCYKSYSYDESDTKQWELIEKQRENDLNIKRS